MTVIKQQPAYVIVRRPVKAITGMSKLIPIDVTRENIDAPVGDLAGPSRE